MPDDEQVNQKYIKIDRENGLLYTQLITISQGDAVFVKIKTTFFMPK